MKARVFFFYNRYVHNIRITTSLYSNAENTYFGCYTLIAYVQFKANFSVCGVFDFFIRLLCKAILIEMVFFVNLKFEPEFKDVWLDVDNQCQRRTRSDLGSILNTCI